MSSFTYTTTDAHKLAGITAARTAYNTSLPTVTDPVTKVVTTPGAAATDQDYVQWVMDNAAQSYANQYKV